MKGRERNSSNLQSRLDTVRNMGKKAPQGLPQDEKMRQEVHLTKPPRLEGVVHSAMVHPKKKEKRK